MMIEAGQAPEKAKNRPASCSYTKPTDPVNGSPWVAASLVHIHITKLAFVKPFAVTSCKRRAQAPKPFRPSNYPPGEKQIDTSIPRPAIENAGLLLPSRRVDTRKSIECHPAVIINGRRP